MNRYSFLTTLVVCVSITWRFGESVTLGLGTYEDAGPADNFDPTICLDKYEVKVGTIIRTEDSMNKKATFVDAVIANSYASCVEKCCAEGIAECDTTVYIEEEKDGTSPTDENCYLFKCWFDGEQDMRCLFSDHEGYISSVNGGFERPRIAGDEENDEKTDATTWPNVRKATTPQPTTNLQRLEPTSETNEANFHIKSRPTTKVPENQDEQVCIATQYRCPQSRECILKRLVCDGIVDCLDKSDEIGCSKTAGGGKKPLSSKPSSRGDIQVKLPESHSGFRADMYENEILPSFVDQSDSFDDDRDIVEPFQLPPSVNHESSPKQTLLHRQSSENHSERDSNELSQSDLEEEGMQQDIQHLRSLAEKQKNRNDLLSMSSKTKESEKFPTLSEVTAMRDDVFRRCQSGRCAPEEQFGDNLAAKQPNWRMRLGDTTAGGSDDVIDMKSGVVKPKTQQHPIMDNIDEEHPVISSSHHGTHLGQDSVLPVTQMPKGHTRFSKPQHVNSPRYGSVISQYRDDDFPEQRYTDGDLFQERPVVHNSVKARMQEDPEPRPKNRLSDPPAVPRDSDNSRTDVSDVHKQPLERPSLARSDMRRPEMRDPLVIHPPVQSVTTEKPMQWLDHKEPSIHVHHEDIPSRIIKPQVDVGQSDYFPEWPVDISFLYGDSYNIGEDWTQLQDNNWRSDPAPKGVQRHNDVDDRWYDDRYDDHDDDQYGFYQPRQRNRGDDRLPSRSRNRYRGNAQQKTHNSGRHKDRNRNYSYGGNNVRQYPSNRKQQVENDFPETGQKPFHPDVSVIQPHLATTVPTPEQGEDKEKLTNNQKTTLPPNPPPPTHVDGIASEPPDAGKEQDLAVDVEPIDTVEVAKGALFPLVVGLLLTLFLLLMVGCRLRFMNRRLRYGRMKNNAHDADYLINGMYL